jgi:protein-disulfide isomerase
LIIAGLGAALIIGALLIVPHAAPPPQAAQTSSAEDSRALGPADAPVTIVEYADFGCPSCKLWHQQGILDQVRQKYGDRVRFVWRDFDVITLNSHKAALAARCAADQGKFWEYHAALFAHAPQFDMEALKQYAADLNLDTTRFNPCLEERQHRGEVLADRQDAFDRGFRGTPTFLIDEQRVEGPPSFETLVELIDPILAKGN